jgi:hypothetical protein
MTTWIACDDGTDITDHDVLRWREPIWKPKQSRKAKPRIIGSREVTAQVEALQDDGFAVLTVMHCVSKRADDWLRDVPQLEKTIRRNVEKLAKNGAERAPWGGADGESVRSSLVRQFTKAVKGSLSGDSGKSGD